MKQLLFIALLSCTFYTAFAQLPTFLQGTWEIEHQNKYEHWEVLNSQHMKGVVYNQQKDPTEILEFLEIIQEKQSVVYKATVPHQNNGQTIVFQMQSNGDTLIFENKKHDFPKTITYIKINDTTLEVRLTDGANKNLQYLMHKVERETTAPNATANPNFNGRLAQQFEADDYGMKTYAFVVLKTGPKNYNDPAFVTECFRGHMENIERLVATGELVVAGPFHKNDAQFRGVFLFDVPTVEAAEKLLQTDPAIAAGLLAYDIYLWYGSAALPAYLDFSDQIWKTKP
jgi:uncharacterized protein YciI